MKSSTIIFLLSIIVWACGNSPANTKGQNLPESAEKLYNTHCAICHGKDGRKGLAGAAVLPESQLSIEERVALITYGKGNMMAYEGVLSKAEIEAIAVYTTKFK